MDKINFSVSPIGPGDLIRLQSCVGWPTIYRDTAQKSLQHTLHSIAAYQNSEFVAYGRILGDGVLYFYLQDVIVVPDYQGKGLGTLVMEKLLAWIRNNAGAGATVGLLSAHGKEGFYQRFGFEARPSLQTGAGMSRRLP